MSETPKPEDFFSDIPPARIIGTETEYNIQITQHTREEPDSEYYRITEYISAEAKQAAGFITAITMMDNGCKLAHDVGHIEISSAEALGPRQAAAVDEAGMHIVRKVVDASGIPHNGIYKLSGTNVFGETKTSGYHENFLIPRHIASDPLLSTIAASHIASRLWAMTGALGNKGIELSAKVHGIGDSAVTFGNGRRTSEKQKPMIMIPSPDSDTDTIGYGGWSRCEVRFADCGFSRENKYVSLAAMSLVLRLIEHQDKLDLTDLNELSFRYHANAAKDFSKDLTFRARAITMVGTSITGLNYQQVLLKACHDLDEKIALPPDEHEAINLWQDRVDRMERSDFAHGEYAGLGDKIDIVPFHRFMSRQFGPHSLNSDDKEAIQAGLVWSRMEPSGPADRYWSQIHSPYISDEEVLGFVHTPPQTRAAARGALIKNTDKLDISSASWAQVGTNIGAIPLNDSYNPTAGNMYY